MTCTKCKSTHTVKNGNREGKQNYLCRTCGRQFTGDQHFIEREKRVAITLCCFGLSMRKVGWLLGYSHVTILNWVRAFERQRVTPSEDYFMEMDEICEFLKERTANPKLGRRFPSVKEALTWNVENEMSKIMEKVFATLDGSPKWT